MLINFLECWYRYESVRKFLTKLQLSSDSGSSAGDDTEESRREQDEERYVARLKPSRRDVVTSAIVACRTSFPLPDAIKPRLKEGLYNTHAFKKESGSLNIVHKADKYSLRSNQQVIPISHLYPSLDKRYVCAPREGSVEMCMTLDDSVASPK